MKNLLIFLLAVTLLVSFAPAKKIGIFETSADIGNPKLTGSAQFDNASKSYTLSGAGYNIWFARDEFQYLFSQLTGDFTVTADVEFVGPGTDKHRKVGWMVRESQAGDASHLCAVVHGDGLTVMQWRGAKGAAMRDPEDEIFSPEKHPRTIQLTRTGNTYIMRVASEGADLQIVGTHDMTNLPGKVLVGLFICSHNPATVEQATVRNVRIVQEK